VSVCARQHVLFDRACLPLRSAPNLTRTEIADVLRCCRRNGRMSAATNATNTRLRIPPASKTRKRDPDWRAVSRAPCFEKSTRVLGGLLPCTDIPSGGSGIRHRLKCLSKICAGAIGGQLIPALVECGPVRGNRITESQRIDNRYETERETNQR